MGLPSSTLSAESAAIFVSDLHLQASQPRTLAAFFTFLQQFASKTRALYLLGDLFEYWAGDDDIPDPCNHSVVKALRAVANGGVHIYWLPGNRDFLVSQNFARAASLTLLVEPYIAEIGVRRLCLVHGDAQCLDDKPYMAFRGKVRTVDWQHSFLSMPLGQRKAIIEGMRQGSREQQRQNRIEIMDVNQEAITALFASTDTDTIIHGHTHRPALHHYAPHRTRHVLTDWDCDNNPQRGGFIALGFDGVLRHMDLHGRELHP